MLHPECSSQGSVGFDDDVVLLAETGDGGAGVEGVDFNLVYCREDA